MDATHWAIVAIIAVNSAAFYALGYSAAKRSRKRQGENS